MIEEITVLKWIKRVSPSKAGRFKKGKLIAVKEVDKEEADAVVNSDGKPLYLKRIKKDHKVKFEKESSRTDGDDFFYEPDTSVDRIFLIESVAWKRMIQKNVWTAEIMKDREQREQREQAEKGEEI
jgi:hypothetical protein